MSAPARLTAPLVRAFVRYVPPRGRGSKVVRLHTLLVPPTEGAIFRTRERSGMRLECDLSSPVDREVYFRGFVDGDVESWVRGWLRPGDLVVDVGAHIGSFTSLALGCIGASGTVHAFEPNPATFARLRRSFGARVPPNAVLRQEALGAASGSARLSEPRRDGAGDRSELATIADVEGYATVAEVAVETLDEVVPGDDRIRLLKIDVEGLEPNVLDGAVELLGKRRADAVLLEINPGALGRIGATPADVFARLRRFGYAANAVSSAGLEPAPGPEAFADRPSDWHTDLVFLPDAGRPGVEVSVVVPTHAGRERLARHLPGLVAAVESLGVSWECLVVDDCSPPERGPRAGALPAGCRLVVLPANAGAAAARNVGARRARGSWLLMVDDDVELELGALRRLWNARRADVCVVPELRGLDGALQNAVVRTSRFAEPRWRTLVEPVADVDYPVGACFLVSRSLFERAGGFDERFRPNYFEDTAFGEALRRVGGATTIAAGTVACHFEWTTGQEAAKQARRRPALSRNRWRYVIHYTRGFSRVAALALAPLRVVHEAVARRSLEPVIGLLEVGAEEGRRAASRLLTG